MTWLYLNYIPSYIPPQLRRASRQRLIERISLFGISSRVSQAHVTLTQDDQAAWLEFWLGLIQTGTDFLMSYTMDMTYVWEKLGQTQFAEIAFST